MLDLNLSDTIAAIATAPGSAGAGTIRLAGPHTVTVVSGLFEASTGTWKTARKATCVHGSIWIPGDRFHIPARLTLWPDHRSYCGQPQAEITLPGCQPLLEATLAECFRHGARGAQPGEFTLRAFLNGKVDLIQAEAVLGVIEARHEADLRVALNQLSGGVSQPLIDLRNDLLNLLADIEAGLDFVDEDIEFVPRSQVIERLQTAFAQLKSIEGRSPSRLTSNSRKRVVLAGRPNAGKSTLLNRLSDADAALVSPIAGTTRDYLLWSIDWEGLSFDLVDTAGWEESLNPITEASQRQREEQMASSDFLLWCSPANLSPAEATEDQEFFDLAASKTSKAIRITTKFDLYEPEKHYLPKDSLVSLSAVNGTGLDQLAGLLRKLLTSDHSLSQFWLGTTAARCHEVLGSTFRALDSALQAARIGTADELLAADLRQVINALGLMTGATQTEDLLDRIFSRFCIGK